MNHILIDKLIRQLTDGGELRDLYKIARNANILILETNLGNNGGLYFYEMRNKTIIINNCLSYYHRLIVLAHEIAHAMLHPFEDSSFTCIGLPKNNQKEKEANLFACKLLNSIGFWENENLCIYEKELSESDFKFIEIYRNYYCKGDLKC